MKEKPSAPLRLRVSALNPSAFVGLILAGGEGKRFGGPKAFAELGDGRTFLEECYATFRGAGAERVVATLPPGAEDPGFEGLDAINLSESGLDMFASVRTGLALLIDYPGWETVAVLPVDHPLVKPESVRALAESGHPAAIPSFRGKHGHPICFHRAIADAVVDGSQPGPTLREVLRAAGAVDVEVDDPGVVANCNTPEALAAALEMPRK